MMNDAEHAHFILRLLEECMSNDLNRRTQAEAQLSIIVSTIMSGNHMHQNELILQTLLQTVSPVTDSQAASLTVPPNLRIITCIWVKNLVLKYWKSPEFVSDRWKTQVFRNALLQMAIQETNQVVALHSSVIVAFISRCDFPTRWGMEELFQPLVNCLQMPQGLFQDLDILIEKQYRAIDIILRITKELVSRRLMAHRKQFGAFAMDLLPFLSNHWDVIMNSSVDGSIVRSVLKLTNISTKLIAVILTNAFRALATQKFELVNAILQKMCHFIARFQAQFSSGQDQKAIEIQAGKCMYQMSKLLMKIQASYPMECRQHLQEFLQLYWEILEANGNADTKIGIVTVRFFTNVLDCELYRTQCGPRTSKVMQKVISANGQVELSDEMIAQAQYTISQFFNMPSQSSDVSRLETLLQRVVLQLMRRSANDLEAWRKDPESFFHLSNNLTAEESIRVAAENLFLTMLQRYPAICIPEFQKLIVQIPEKLQYIINTHPTSSLESFEMSLEMDSILLALGLGSFILYQHIDFEPLYTSAFYPLFARPYAYHIGSLVWEGAVLPLVFNRSIWLIGRWLGQLVPSHWPFLYQSVMTNSFGIEEAASTSNLEDIALKLQTTSLIECMAADWSFQLDHLKPYLPMILHGLYSLLMTTGTLESKQKILCTLETIAKVLGPSIIVYLPQLCTPLATLWARPSDDSNLVRGSILRFLKQILLCVNELLSDDTEYEMDAIQHKLLPLQEMCLQGVQSAVNAKPADPYLLENGLALWYQLILSVKDYSDQLAAIFPHALEIVQLEYEHGLTILGIIEKYLKLDGSERFWDVYHAPILSICITPMIKNVKSQVSIALAHLLERILEHLQIRGMIFSSFSNELVEPTQRLVACCVEYSENHEDKEPESVIISYLHVFALLVLFLDQCDWVYVSVLNSDSKVLTQLVDLMLDKFPSGHAQCINTNSSSVWYPWQLRKKLWASALISLLAWRIPGCVDRVGDIKRIANDILKETQSDDHQQQQIRGTKWEKVTRFDLKSCLDRNGKSLRNQ